MKKILTLLTSILISGTIGPATLQTTTNNNLNNYSAITKSINFSFYRLGTMSSGHTWDHKVITLLYYKQYANSWSDFTNKYSTLKLLNFDGKSGGQGTTVSRNSYEIKTKDIQFDKQTTILRYDYHLIVCVQMRSNRFYFCW